MIHSKRISSLSEAHNRSCASWKWNPLCTEMCAPEHIFWRVQCQEAWKWACGLERSPSLPQPSELVTHSQRKDKEQRWMPCHSQLSETKSFLGSSLPRRVWLQGSGLGEGWEKAVMTAVLKEIKGEKVLVLSIKKGNGELCRSQIQEVNYRRLG